MRKTMRWLFVADSWWLESSFAQLLHEPGPLVWGIPGAVDLVQEVSSKRWPYRRKIEAKDQVFGRERVTL